MIPFSVKVTFMSHSRLVSAYIFIQKCLMAAKIQVLLNVCPTAAAAFV